MSLDKIVQDIIEPHVGKIKAYIVNNIIEDVVEMVLDVYAEYNVPHKREELLKKLIERFGVKNDATE